MKRSIVIFFLMATIIASAGIDEMKRRDPGMPPGSDVPGNGNGGGNGGNPNVPIDDWLIPFVILVGGIGIWSLKGEKERTRYEEDLTSYWNSFPSWM